MPREWPIEIILRTITCAPDPECYNILARRSRAAARRLNQMTERRTKLKTWRFSFHFNELPVPYAAQSATAAGSQIETAFRRAWKNVAARPGVKGRHLKAFTVAAYWVHDGGLACSYDAQGLTARERSPERVLTFPEEVLCVK